MNIDLTRVKETVTVEWVVTTILVALLINLVAAYAKTGVDKLLSVSSENWKDFRRTQRERREDRIARASEDAYFLLLLLAREMRLRSRLVCYLIGAMFFYLVTFFEVFASGNWRLYFNIASAFVLLWWVESLILIGMRYEIDQAYRRHLEQPRPTSTSTPN